MRTILQVVFCILSVLSVIAAMVFGIWKGFAYALSFALLTVIFALLMLLAKFVGKDPKEETPDFLNTPEENERLPEQKSEQESSSPEEK